MPIVCQLPLNASNATPESVARAAEHLPWGTPDEIVERIIDDADHAGANTVLVSMNRGAMPQDLFLNQIRRFGAEVLPRLHAHTVKPPAFLQA